VPAEDLANNEHGCILVVDDEDALRRVLVKKLRSEGYSTVEARNGADAAALLEAQPIDVVVSDIAMPDLGGVELLQLVRQQKPDVPVLLMTGAPQLDSAVQAVEHGAFAYLVKPFTLEKLATSVARAVKEHRNAVARRHAAFSAVRTRSSPPSKRASDEITKGTLLGRYRVVREIGSGGMGTVYEAERDDVVGMRVAVKVIDHRLATRPDLVTRFRREARLIAALRHPNIVAIHDVVFDDPPLFFVMELLEGAPLTKAIASGEISDERCAFIASQVLDALDTAHAARIVHRDLKPDNVFLTRMSGIDDVVKLLDFGVAKALGDEPSASLTQAGFVVGTPAYMAPEHARGERFDARSDLYAVGCVMYEMLTRKQPFEAANYNALLHAIQYEEPDDLRKLRPDVSSELIGVVRRAMAKDPDARFASARAMRDALGVLLK
jgi:CheY-like chemotaxis protein/tRNA A-37 threonylcarbamoyl transferase component Bud32